MITASEAIVASVERGGVNPRHAVQAAAALAREHGLEIEVLRSLEGKFSYAALWLRAALIETKDGWVAAEPHWARIVNEDGCETPDVLLHRARAIAREGKMPAAAPLLRRALQGNPDHDFFLRAETLIRKCRSAFGCQRKVKIALLGSSTTTLLRSVMEALCLRDDLDPEFYVPPFGTFRQELLSEDSGLKIFQPEFIVLVMNWRDLGLPLTIADNPMAAQAVDSITDIWHTALETTSAQILQLSFAPPVADPGLALSSLMPGGLARTIREVNQTLIAQSPARVTLIDSERIAAASNGTWDDPLAWSSARLYPAPAVLPMIAAHFVSCIRAELGLSKKLLLLDLDNTLWGGIVGEDGLDGIRLGPPSSLGERYHEFHRYLKALKERGVLLAVVSKNNPEDAAAVFRSSNSILRLEDFVSFKVNWSAKTENVRQIAAELRLGMDSFVLLDDNPAERLAVRLELPDVLVPEIPGEPSESIRVLERGLYFQATRFSQEDLDRTASYMANARQGELRSRAESVEEYLEGLQMEIEHGPVDPDTCLRVAQLINKTNQFNLTTRRYRQDEVQKRIAPPNYWFQWYRLRDRFADHGLIAVLLAETMREEWVVDVWLMSCRVIGRGVEDFMFRDLAKAAVLAGAKSIRASYIPSAKNQIVAELLPKFGFLKQSDEYFLDLSRASLPSCSFLKDRRAAEEFTSIALSR